VQRTSWSVNTLQEQTIMAGRPGDNWFDLQLSLPQPV
jgi:hypothetical protein